MGSWAVPHSSYTGVGDLGRASCNYPQSAERKLHSAPSLWHGQTNKWFSDVYALREFDADIQEGSPADHELQGIEVRVTPAADLLVLRLASDQQRAPPALRGVDVASNATLCRSPA